jgi:hypothetical protein
MPNSKESLDQFIEFGDAVFTALNGYGVHEDKAGRACARGTLTARLNSLRIISGALETRDANAKDTAELKGLLSTLNWLKSDAYVTKDFTGIEITVAPTPFATAYPAIGLDGDTDFVSAISTLERGIIEVLLA